MVRIYLPQLRGFRVDFGVIWLTCSWLGEYLEWIVIVLIAAEILVAAINIVVDLYAGVD